MKFRDGVSATATYVNFPVVALFPRDATRSALAKGRRFADLPLRVALELSRSGKGERAERA